MEPTAPRGDASEVPESTGSQDEPMVVVRPGAPTGALLARARVLGALFGDHSTAGAFRRFRVLDRLGAGGMGVVYEAYDPDLARGVALKFVAVAGDREAALAEAKALARLSHPNVVPIFDVGLEGDRVYLVMELVRGHTLRQWASGRDAADVVAAYRQAALALAAAHAAGLVHRDFKPDNALIGTDGRVRVVDFGLACEVDDPARASGERRPIAGTPRYMAPEIKAGAPVTPAADQYSFAVALTEALDGNPGGVPRRIAAALERGRAPEPAARFASMTELLHALARDPARIWRRAAAIGGLAAAAAAVAFTIGRQRPAAGDPCDAVDAQLEAAWGSAGRAVALDRLSGLGVEARLLRPRLQRVLEDHARDWKLHARRACSDRSAGLEPSTLSERRTLCLQRGSDALAAVGELMRRAGPAELEQLPRVVQSLPDPALCSDVEVQLLGVPPPPRALAASVADLQREVTRARVYVDAGRADHALELLPAAVERARQLGYAPLLAEALLALGHAKMTVTLPSAVPVLDDAVNVAAAEAMDALLVEAWSRRAFAAKGIEPERALDEAHLVEQLAKRPACTPFARALFYNTLGTVELARRHRDVARAHFERALAESPTAITRRALELVNIRANLAIVTDDRARADQLLAEAAAELSDRLGPDHPDTLAIRHLRGSVTIDDLRQANDVLTAVCGAYDAYPAAASPPERCWIELGMVRSDLGLLDGAAAAMQHALQRPGRNAAAAAAYLTLFRGDARTARRRFADALAKPAGDKPWDQTSRGLLTLGLGIADRALGDLRGARGALRTAIAEFGEVEREYPAALYERRIGRGQIELALTLGALGERSAERTAVESAAAAWRARAGANVSAPEASPVR